MRRARRQATEGGERGSQPSPSRHRADVVVAALLSTVVVCLLTTSAFVMFLPTTSSAAAQTTTTLPWQMAQQNPQHTSASPLPGPVSNATSWTFTVTQPFKFSPVIDASGTVYLLGSDHLYAINPGGSLKWMTRISSPVGSPALSPDGSVVYIPSAKSVAALATSTGASRWNLSTSGNGGADLTVAPNGQIYSVNNGEIYSITPSGGVSWTASAGCSTSSIAVGPSGDLYCGARKSYNGTLYAISPSGTTEWTYTQGGIAPVQVAPTVGPDGTIYVVKGDGVLVALSPTGTVEWSVSGVGGMNTPAAVDSAGTVFMGGPKLEAYSPSGAQTWTESCYPGPGGVCVPFGTISGITIDSSSNLYVSTTYNNVSRLVALTSSGTFLWSYSPSSNLEMFTVGAAIGPNGFVYIGSNCLTCMNGQPWGRFYAIGAAGYPYQASFSSMNLPAGTFWSVVVDNQTFVTNDQEMLFPQSSGTHAWTTQASISVGRGARYAVAGPTSGQVTVPQSSGPLVITYAEQFAVQLGVTPSNAGTTSAALTWVDGGSDLNISATAARGFVFSRWSANTTSLTLTNTTASATSVLVNGPGGIVAVFAPAPPQQVNLTVISGTGGSVAYNYLGLSGTVQPGASRTITVPAGAAVTLQAMPEAGYALSSWTSPILTSNQFGQLASIIFTVSATTSVTANFAISTVSTTQSTGPATSSPASSTSTTTSVRSGRSSSSESSMSTTSTPSSSSGSIETSVTSNTSVTTLTTPTSYSSSSSSTATSTGGFLHTGLHLGLRGWLIIGGVILAVIIGVIIYLVLGRGRGVSKSSSPAGT